MKLDFVFHWEYNLYNDTFAEFVKEYSLSNEFKIGLKEEIVEVLKKKKKEFSEEKRKLTEEEILDCLQNDLYECEETFLEKLANQYIVSNDEFDMVVIVEGREDLYTVAFYRIVPSSQDDVKRFMEKHLQAYKDGFGEVVDEVIKKKLSD